jgi:copper oxidase (laccase) domain-containing protein
VSGLCTSCRTDLFYSHRAERGNTGRFGALINIHRATSRIY